MQPNRPGSEPKKKRHGLWWKLPLSGFVLLLIAFGAFRFEVHQRLASRLDAIREAGYPVTPKQLNAWYAMPKDRNAADVYQQAFEAYRGDYWFEKTLPMLGDRVKMPEPGEAMAEDVAKRVAYYVQQNAEAISLLKEAAGIDGCRFPVDFESDLFPLLPHLGPLRQGARLMSLSVLTDIHNQDLDQAVDDCLVTLAMARSLDREPVLISALVGISLEVMAFNQVQYVLQTGRASDEQLQTLYDAVSRTSCRESMSRGMVGERCMGMSIFLMRASAMGWNQTTGSQVTWSLWQLSGLADLDQAYYIDCMTYYCDLVDDPVWPIPPISMDDPPRYYMISRIMVPALGASTRSIFRTDMQHQVLLTAIAAERYRLANGDWPKTLQDLVPEFMDDVPTDVYVDKPLRYRHEGDAIVIYSLGPDETDQSGRPYDETGNPSTDDPIDYSVVLGTTEKEMFPFQEDDSDTWWDDEPIDDYLKEIAKEGFPELVPRPLDGKWPEDEDVFGSGWGYGAEPADPDGTGKADDDVTPSE